MHSQESLLRFYQQGGKKRFEKSIELEERRNVMKQDVSPAATAPHTPPRTASYSYLMAGLTELTLADELSVQTQFDSFPQKACKQKNNI